jgi:hypothetical protein
MNSVYDFPLKPYATDWLGTNAVFYDLPTSRAALTINELLDGNVVEPDLIGISNYLNYGFSVFGRTIVENIRITEPNSVLKRLPSGALSYEVLNDPVIQMINQTSTSEDVENLITEWFDRELALNPSKCNNYILPLSGGLDSAMLAWFLKGRKNVHAFTYGISWFQKFSFETLNARATAHKLNMKWNQIKLGKFHNFLEMQHELYGATMHAHSMYHFEFYSKIREYFGPGKLQSVSGIYGDLWAGSWSFDFKLQHPSDLRNLAIRHGVYSEGLVMKFQELHPDVCFTLDEEEFFNKNRELLANSKFRIITAARIKMSLIRHLIDTPTFLGIDTISPFLDIEIAMSMLNLPKNVRMNRSWQKTFLKEKNILPRKNRFADYSNDLDFYGCYKCPPKPFDKSEDIPFLPRVQIEELIAKSRVNRRLVILRILNNRILSRFQLRVLNELLNKQYIAYVDLMLMTPLLKTFSKRLQSNTVLEK